MPPRHVLTILAVDDLSEAVSFYRTAFGWSASVETPVYVEFALPKGARLGLYQREAFGSNTGQVPDKLPEGALASTEIYLHTEALDAAIASLRRAGARELSPCAPRPWGDEAAYFADLLGNVIVVARPLLDRSVQTVEAERGKLCRNILEALPDWFGIPDSIEEYVEHTDKLPMFSIVTDGQAIGFISVKEHFERSAEVYVMGILPTFHRRGHGRRLIAAAERYARERGLEFLTVKTLSATSSNAAYARTREFYQALGFQALEEFPDLWGPTNPCLLMAKSL